MTDITDPEAVRFANEFIRPQAEIIRALNAAIDAGATEWYGGLNVKFPNDGGYAVQDGRDAEGVSRLTGGDINSFMSIILAMKAASNTEIISKPCVRFVNS